MAAGGTFSIRITARAKGGLYEETVLMLFDKTVKKLDKSALFGKIIFGSIMVIMYWTGQIENLDGFGTMISRIRTQMKTYFLGAKIVIQIQLTEGIGV